MAEKLRVEFDFGPGNGKQVFRSVEDVKRFFNDELSRWQWLRDVGMSSLANFQNRFFTSIHTAVQQLPSDADARAFQPLLVATQEMYQDWRMPLSSSRLGKFIFELKATNQSVAAACLVSHFAPDHPMRDLDIHNPNHIRGVVDFALFSDGVDKRTPEAVTRSLEDLAKQYQDESTKAIDGFNASLETLAAEWRKTEERNRATIDGMEADYDVFIEASRKAANDQIEKLKETQKTYEEYMQLKAPVTYWTRKAEQHRSSSSFFAWVLGLYAAAATVILLVFLGCLAIYVIEHVGPERPPSAQVLVVSLGVIVTTVIFWVGRILTRLYLSQHHLAIDADERATMVQTYLALISNSAATPDERGIVLGSLFRSASDGIVKDDGAPDLSVASLMSKVGK